MHYSRPVTDIIKKRFSCRKYNGHLTEEQIKSIKEFIHNIQTGPAGASAEITMMTAKEEDRKALKGLSTYGFIRGEFDFVIGAMGIENFRLEDFGYLMEKVVLFAEDIGLGTCWLGGTFNKSVFAERIGLDNNKRIPSVLSIGRIANPKKERSGLISRFAGSSKRFPWEKLFFHNSFGNPLEKIDAGMYQNPLEMVRLAPSGSNKQPWRIIKDDGNWHFYLCRSKGYRDGLLYKLAKCDDIQLIDMGIAMCHFELTALENGLRGIWKYNEPKIKIPDEMTEYIFTWKEQD